MSKISGTVLRILFPAVYYGGLYVKFISRRQRQPFSDYNRRVYLFAVCAGGALDFSHIRRCEHQHLQSGRHAAAPGTAR